MKSTSLILPLSLLACFLAGPSFGLEGGDSMARWNGASVEEKRKLVASLLKKDGAESAVAKVLECLNAASAVSGHAELSIRELVEACKDDHSQPV